MKELREWIDFMEGEIPNLKEEAEEAAERYEGMKRDLVSARAQLREWESRRENKDDTQ